MAIPGPIDGLTSIASDSEPVVMKVAKQLQERERSTDLVEQMIALGERAEPLEPNETLRNRISMATSLLREGPKDS